MTSDLELLTVNLWGLPWPVARERRDRKRHFLEHVSRRAYDLVGIQELWWPWRRALRAARLRLPRSGRDSGLALGGRLPIRDAVRVEPFRDQAGFDRVKRKGLLKARVEAGPGATVAVYVTHLQAGRRHAVVRSQQIDQLLDRLSAEPQPALLMGDFNLHGDVDEDRLSHERLRGAGLVDAAVAVSRDEPTYEPSNPYVRRRRRAERFDRVYLRPAAGVRLEALDVEVLQLRPRPLSDHHPVRVRVRLSG